MDQLRAPERRPGARIDADEEWIRRSGVVTRRFAGPDGTVVTMAAEAARKAMARSRTSPNAIDRVRPAAMSLLERAPGLR